MDKSAAQGKTVEGAAKLFDRRERSWRYRIEVT